MEPDLASYVRKDLRATPLHTSLTIDISHTAVQIEGEGLLTSQYTMSMQGIATYYTRI